MDAHPNTETIVMSSRDQDLTAKMEPFDSFWEAPEDVEKGYERFYKFYKHNYLPLMPADKQARVLVISCGPGYFVETLRRHGYERVLGIDSMAEKVDFGVDRGLNCRTERLFEHLDANTEPYDLIMAEQEINHLTKPEILLFLETCLDNLSPGGKLLLHAINGSNPMTGSESRAGNFDHYCSFTEYSIQQVLKHCGFVEVQAFPLKLYVFFSNPLNYIGWVLERLTWLWFRFNYLLVGKSAKIYSKKIGAQGVKPSR